jgi:S1-C subfamily serine protease
MINFEQLARCIPEVSESGARASEQLYQAAEKLVAQIEYGAERNLRASTVDLDLPHQTGKGFIVDSDLIATSGHVVADLKSDEFYRDLTIWLEDGSKRLGRVVLCAPHEDLALLHVPNLGNVAPKLNLGGHGGLTEGDSVFAMQHTGYMRPFFLSGPFEYSYPGRNPHFEFQHPTGWLRAAIPGVKPGASGGPIVDRTGTVYGVTTFGRLKSITGLLAEHIKLAQSELAHGLPERGWLKFGTEWKSGDTEPRKLYSKLIST